MKPPDLRLKLMTKHLKIKSNPKVALVYDWVDKYGGAERLLESLRSVFPKAPLFTSVYNPQKSTWATSFTKVNPSWLSAPIFPQKHELLFPLIPISFESFDFSSFDLVISVTSAFAKGILTKPPTTHLCYFLAPTRFLWQEPDLYRQSMPVFLRPFWDPLASYLRFWDKIAANRPDYYVSISNYIGSLVKKIYQRDILKTIYPPVDLNTFTFCPSKNDYFLVVSRLVPYKKIEIVVRAFNRLGQKLLIAGDGSQKSRLQKMARSNIKFLGFVPESQVVKLMQSAKALIHPQIEDFGLTVLEAGACGTPVLAFAKGGALETLIPGKTGDLFYSQTPEAIVDLIRSTDFSSFSPAACRANSEKFSLASFQSHWREMIY